MPFIDANDTSRRWLVGPEDGASRLLLYRRVYPAGFYVGLHRHDGEETHVILRGEVRFHAGGERRVLHGGDASFAPVDAVHGFLTLTEAEMLTVREQELKSWVIVLEPDGGSSEVETFGSPPWGKEAPEGARIPTDEEVREWYDRTRHLV